VDDCAILELFINAGRLVGDQELRKTRATAPSVQRPAWDSDGERRDPVFDVGNIDSATMKLTAQAVIIVVERVETQGIQLGDLVVGKREGHFGVPGFRKPCMSSHATNWSSMNVVVVPETPMPKP
jgi:hypothetical protein